jgi:fructose/tagatose bisphosphate aldolase
MGEVMFRRIWNILQIVWTTTIVCLAATVGAVHGWENHGLIGAIALGFCGLIIGGVLSSPDILLQILA